MASIPLYPYGYKLNFLGTKELHEERAAVVRLIYQKYLEGMNRYAITWYLVNRKIPRPRGDSYDWQYSMVNKILKDERYLGTEKFPAILTKDVFEAVQEKLKAEKDKAIAKRHESCNDKRVYPFSGFIKCDSCGSNYIRGIQNYNRGTRKATWRCCNYRLKKEGKCKASGNIYEEVLEVVLAEAYNKVRKDYVSGKIPKKSIDKKDNRDKTLDFLIEEIVAQMKDADDARCNELQKDLNILLAKKTEMIWEAAPLDMSEYETEKILQHFKEYPKPMLELDIDLFKAIFEKIIAYRPGQLKLILKNGVELIQEYKPMRGQVENAKKHRNYSCKADKRT